MTVFINDSVCAEGGFPIYAGIFPGFTRPELLRNRQRFAQIPQVTVAIPVGCVVGENAAGGSTRLFFCWFFFCFVFFFGFSRAGFKFTVTQSVVRLDQTRCIEKQQNSLTHKHALFVLMKIKIHEIDPLNESERRINP